MIYQDKEAQHIAERERIDQNLRRAQLNEPHVNPEAQSAITLTSSPGLAMPQPEISPMTRICNLPNETGEH